MHIALAPICSSARCSAKCAGLVKCRNGPPGHWRFAGPAARPTSHEQLEHNTGLTCTSDLSGVMDLELAHWRPLHPAGIAGGQAERRRGGASAHWRSGAAVWRFLLHLTAWHAGTCLPQCFCDVFRSRNVTSLMPSVSVTEPRTRVPPSESARST